MKQVKDATGRAWEISATVSTLTRVRDLAGVDFVGLTDPGELVAAANDEIKMVNILYAACKPQADAAGLTDIQFGESWNGVTIDSAYTAFFQELADFFRSPAKRRAVLEVLTATREFEERLERTLPNGKQIGAEAANSLAATGQPSTAPQVYAASFPMDSPGDN